MHPSPIPPSHFGSRHRLSTLRLGGKGTHVRICKIESGGKRGIKSNRRLIGECNYPPPEVRLIVTPPLIRLM